MPNTFQISETTCEARVGTGGCGDEDVGALYSGPVCQVQKSVFGKIAISPFEWRLEIRREV